jgi:hypothetical protein
MLRDQETLQDDARLLASVRSTQMLIWTYLLDRVSEPLASLFMAYQSLSVLERVLISGPASPDVDMSEVRAGVRHTMEHAVQMLQTAPVGPR